MSTFAQLMAKSWQNNNLVSVLVELTYRCNLNCFFCYNDLGLQGQPLDREQYLTLWRDLADMQVLNLTLSGGEPLSHPDFLDLGRAARELGFVVRIKSNGHALRGTLARRIRDEVDPFLIEVSLHGAQAATHDRQTRVPGSFDRLLANLRAGLDLGLRIKINSTLTRWNEHEIEEMFALADELGVRLQFDPEVSPRDDGDTEPLRIGVSADGLRRLFAIQTRRAEAQIRAGEVGAQPEVMREGDAVLGDAPVAPDKHCGAGSSGIAIDPVGNVYPCVQWRRPAGNLHRSSIKEIWTGSAELDAVRRLTVDVKKMVGAQEEGHLLNFCPGTAAAQTGSALALYEGATARRMVVRELADAPPSRPSLPILS